MSTVILPADICGAAGTPSRCASCTAYAQVGCGMTPQMQEENSRIRTIQQIPAGLVIGGGALILLVFVAIVIFL